MIDPQDITWVILAGGQATRMHNQDKGLVKFQNRPLIEYTLTRLQQQLPKPVVINANRNIERYAHYGEVIEDLLPGYLGPLAGIHSGLRHAQTSWVGFSPCDSPFTHRELITRFCQYGGNDVDALVAHDGERAQPAFVLLHRSSITLLEAYLATEQRRLMGFIKQLNYRDVIFDDEPHAFTNINSLEEIQYYTMTPPQLSS
ncbi:MAG: molybdenum cofactor guanylyltransferase MobA [Vibrio sp.]